VEARRVQIDRMVALAEGHQCRMTALVQHFGDTTDRRGPCGRCDVCRPQAASGAAGHAPDAEECRTLRAILKALEVRGTSTGKLFSELKLTPDRRQFDALLDGLARAGLIAIANDTFTNPEGNEITYRKATITHEGRSPDDAALATVWIRGEMGEKAIGKKARPSATKATRSYGVAKDGLKPVPFKTALTAERQRRDLYQPQEQAHKAASGPALELNPAQAALEERMKLWRRQEAGKAGLPSFFVFSDTVLRNIVAAGPTTLTELGAVRGVGPDKLERFGAAVLELCRG